MKLLPLLGIGAAAAGATYYLTRTSKPASGPFTPQGKRGVIDEPKKFIISMMGLRSAPPGFEDWKIIEWPGEGPGHPSWFQKAARLRRNGRLLPVLMEQFQIPADAEIGAVGFSAGSNSGMREILRDSADRKRLSFAVAADGFHAAIKDPRARTDDPRTWFFAFNEQVAPFANAALEAAKGGTPFVQTASTVAAPNKTMATSELGVIAIDSLIRGAGESEFRPLPAPLEAVSDDIELGGRYSGEKGQYVNIVVKGNSAADHIFQANAVIPAAMKWIKTRLENRSA
jgi:hypothetical protein